MNADFSHTCEGCEHVVTEPWAKDIISYRCFAPGRCKGRVVGGEAENAEKLLARMMKKYGISEEELDEETRVRHDFTYHGGEEKKILRQVVYKVTGGYAYELVYTASGRKVRTQLGADCTPAEKVEIEYLFDFYKRLWEKEKDAFLAAYIQKHRIFAIRADVEPQEISREEALKMGALMQGMSDESPLRAIEAGK